MKKVSISFLILAGLLHPCPPLRADVARRIVSLKPAITDVIVAMGQGDRLVGVTKYCEVPSEIARPAIVGDYTRPYLERIIALRPDVVLNSRENSSRKSIERLRETGVVVELLPFGSRKDILASTERIGEIIGHADDGKRLALDMQRSLAEIETRWKKLPRVRVLIVWGRRPLVVAGGGSFIDEYLPGIGAINVMSATKIPYPRIGLEELISLDPDVIVDLSMGSEGKGSDGRIWDKAPTLKAVRNKRVYILSTSDFRPGPRLIKGLGKLADLIHEE